MNEIVVSFCGCLKSSIIYIKPNILYFWKIVDEIINNSRAIEILYLLDFNTLKNSKKENIKLNNF